MFAILFLAELHAVKLESAASVSFVLLNIMFVVIISVGCGLALKEGLDWRRLRQIGAEVSQ